ncbi:MAG: heme exporter protein CcmB [Idiomarina sp.]|jgi:heme exporter protein B|uniref:heme exporter protein CcmB n=1 Tax=Idiomarina sp. TaxID=1874361 RepID=UPI000C0D43A2|nr:heme exporter protein CcmB [Idiomarina sp.]MBL4741677.1 heme exporter protein CcmB [Idiomarina sp.]MBT41253.1 heme exporter protein CcmB [Idiomarina sp.]PHQ77692.1 MAG: heme exporter protein CcmB [Idiomarina sp.]HAD47325.1 heme exporter protein CcmB [Idiomarina sp.]
MSSSVNSTALWRSVLVRDLRIAARRRSDALNPLLFLLMVVTLFPLGVGPGPDILARIAPGIIWVAALLATLLGLDRLFKDDYNDGSLEQLCLLPQPLAFTLTAKVAAHWLLSGLPLVILSPVLALLLNLPLDAWWALALTLLLGTPALSALGAIGAALTLQLQRGGTLISLILLPLFIPLLIFATSAVENAGMGLAVHGQLAILAAISVLTVTLAPLAMAAAVRMSMN